MTILTVKNTGGFSIPFDVVVTYANGTTATLHQTPRIWQANAKQTQVTIPSTNAISTIHLDGVLYMDATEADNTWKAQ